MKPIARAAWTAILTALFLLDIWMVFLWTPVDKNLGHSQKIFYFHVGSAMAGFLAFTVAFVCGIGWLARRRDSWDNVEAASVEVGVVFASITMMTGSIWARTAWNAWWIWDEPRLTTMGILLLSYIAYLIVRASLSGDARAKASAVMAILFGINIPITWMSIYWWTNTFHPQMGGLKGSGLMNSSMRITFWFSVLLFILLYVHLVRARTRLESASKTIRALNRERLFGGGQ